MQISVFIPEMVSLSGIVLTLFTMSSLIINIYNINGTSESHTHARTCIICYFFKQVDEKNQNQNRSRTKCRAPTNRWSGQDELMLIQILFSDLYVLIYFLSEQAIL